MTLCLLVAWSIVGMAVVKGIQSSGKVSWDRAAGSREQELEAQAAKEEYFSDSLLGGVRALPLQTVQGRAR